MTSKKILLIFPIFLVGGLLFWVVDEFIHRNEVREIRELARDALCVVDLKEGNGSVSNTFSTSETIDRLYVRVCPLAGRERLSLSIQRDDSSLYRGTIEGSQRFSLGGGIPAGTFTVALSQLKGRQGAIVVITDKEPVAIRVTGWQVLSRAYLGLLVGCAIWVLVCRHSANRYRRVPASGVLQYLFLGFLAMFHLPLLHEGGHALAQMPSALRFLEKRFLGDSRKPPFRRWIRPMLEPWSSTSYRRAGVLPTLVRWGSLFLEAMAPRMNAPLSGLCRRPRRNVRPPIRGLNGLPAGYYERFASRSLYRSLTRNRGGWNS
jgi:hypothetical protein